MLALIGILIGLIVGLLVQLDIPSQFSTYVGVIILASVDSMIGALNASLQNRYNTKLFITGLVGNSFIAVVLTSLGRALELDLRLAAVFAFSVRIFNNFSSIRRLWLRRVERRQRYSVSWRSELPNIGSTPSDLKPSDFNVTSRAQELQERAQRLRQEADAVAHEADLLWEQEAMELRRSEQAVDPDQEKLEEQDGQNTENTEDSDRKMGRGSHAKRKK